MLFVEVDVEVDAEVDVEVDIEFGESMGDGDDSVFDMVTVTSSVLASSDCGTEA